METEEDYFAAAYERSWPWRRSETSRGARRRADGRRAHIGSRQAQGRV